MDASRNVHAGPNWISALWRGGSALFRAFWKFGRQLFHEAVGMLFALFALYAGTAAWKQGREPRGQWIAAFALGYALMMAVFSVWSFRSARRVR